ncbi:tape measure protein [Mesorhizobium sp. BR1-1-12]|uniref:tape measure protein n=1 Tax=Mesorhizobium sp. BR1-1-12 TaxID=2876657 RepID=UPI001CD089C9|nr:tape measure protein [Mesorhizobium sp. BR1-1-12]MBZ9973512.1 tape measure protein [Mesorhizobium sp. BR1-1-12]
MATDLERLVVQLSADVKQYNNALNKAISKTNSSARTIEARFATMNKKLSSQFASLGGIFAKGLAIAGIGGGISGAQALIDSAIRIENALKVAGLSGTDLTKVYDNLYASAQRNAAPFEALVTLYSRVSSASKELGANAQQVAGFTDTVAKALRLTGGSAEESRGALLQLSQAMGGNVIQAQEYNSLIDGLRPLLQAAAAGIKEAGGSVAELTQLVKAGKVSSKAFFDGIEAGASVLDDKLQGATLTTSQGFEILTNSLVKAAGKFNDSTEAGQRFGSALQAMATYIDQIDFDNILHGLDAVADKLNYVNNLVQNFGAELGKMLGTDVVGKFLAGTSVGAAIGMTSPAGISDRMAGDVPQANAAIQAWAEKNYGSAVTTAKTDRLPSAAAVNPISLADYPVKPTKTPKTHAPKKTADDRFAEDIQSIRDRTAALKEEQATLGLSFYEQQKRKVSLDLEQEALKQVREEARKKGEADWQNAQLTPDQIAKINAVSDAYAKQADELRKARDMQDLQRDVLKGAFDDLRSALDDGKLDWQDFAKIAEGALDKIIDKIENDLIDSILQANGAAGGGGGILGSLLGMVTGGGGSDPGIISALGLRAKGGPVTAGQPYIVGEKRAELFVPNQSGTIVPRVPSITAGGGGGQNVSVSFAPTINMPNAQKGAGEEVAQALKKFEREFTPRVLKSLRDARTTGMV